MATPPESVRQQLAVVTTYAAADMRAAAEPQGSQVPSVALLAALPDIVPPYYDAAGELAALWYDELREEARPRTAFTPRIIGDPVTDWIDREAAKFLRELDAMDFEAEMKAAVDEITRLAEKEIARGFRDTILGNARTDEDAIGWSRVTRAGACKLCQMLAEKGAVYREATASFAAHTDCHCAARPEFKGGEHGPEATVEQYIAAKKRRTANERARLRKYLNANYPDARG